MGSLGISRKKVLRKNLELRQGICFINTLHCTRRISGFSPGFLNFGSAKSFQTFQKVSIDPLESITSLMHGGLCRVFPSERRSTTEIRLRWRRCQSRLLDFGIFLFPLFDSCSVMCKTMTRVMVSDLEFLFGFELRVLFLESFLGFECGFYFWIGCFSSFCSLDS